MYRLFSLSFAILIFAGSVAGTAHGQFNALARRVPNDANAIVFIDVARLMSSPLAVKEGWQANAQEAFESGLLMIPPNVERFVASANLDFQTMGAKSHHYIFQMSVDPDFAKLAARLNGSVDNFDGREAAVLPGDYFAVKFVPNIVVVGNPAERQNVAYYVRRVENNSLQLSEYLEEAKKFAEDNAPIIMALDLQHALPVPVIRAKLDTLESLKGKNLNLDAVAEALASVRGLTLGVNVGDTMTGSLKVDFGSDVSILGDAVKPLLLEILGNRGMMIDELEEWTIEANASKTSVRLIGKLEESGLRRVMSLIPVPPPLQHAREEAAQVPEAEAQAKLAVAASQNYFKSVDSLVTDLTRSKRNRATNGQTAVFFDRFADRIDRLPSLNVDPYLLDMGAFISGSLRNGSGAVRGSLVAGNLAAMNVQQQYDINTWFNPIGVVGSNGWGSGGGVYGWSGWEATPNVVRTSNLQIQARTEQQVQGNMSANQIMAEIQKALGDTRRQMTQKFGVQF